MHLTHVRDLKHGREYWQWIDSCTGKRIRGMYKTRQHAYASEGTARKHAIRWHLMHPGHVPAEGSS